MDVRCPPRPSAIFCHTLASREQRRDLSAYLEASFESTFESSSLNIKPQSLTGETGENRTGDGTSSIHIICSLYYNSTAMQCEGPMSLRAEANVLVQVTEHVSTTYNV